MYDIIIDPARIEESTTIWIGDCVTSVKGEISTVCRDIADRVLLKRKNEKGYIVTQTKSIGVDINGVGRMWVDYLISFGLEVHEIKYKRLDNILPKIN